MMKRYTGVLAALAAGVLIFTSGITGEAARTGTITTDGSRVRATADAEGQKVCSLPLDTIVDITDETQSGGKTWYQISFTLDGAQKTGWIRSDLLSVTETEDPQEEQPTEEESEPEEGAGGEAGSAAIGAYTIQEPEAEYEGADSLEKTTVSVGEQSYTAYQSALSEELYLVWAAKEDGSKGWYWYDPSEETFQRDAGQFSQSGLINSLQNELTTLKTTTAKSLSQRLYIMIGLGVLSVILLVLTIVFAVKSRNADYEYEDEDQDDEDDGDDFDDFVEAAKKKRFGRREKQAEDEYEDEEDYSGESAYDEDVYDMAAHEEEEKPDLSLTANLPEIDLSALEEVEEEPEEKTTEPVEKSEPETEPETDEEDGLDIEILDLDDLNL